MKAVYKITHIETGNAYVGSSKNVNIRMSEHRTKNRDTRISKAIRSYGVDAFKFEILEEVFEDVLLPTRESYWIDQLNPSFNQRKYTGRAGASHTKETREALSLCGKMFWDGLTEDQRRDIVQNQLTGPKVGHIVTDETKRKLRLANLGKKQSADTIHKRTKTMKIVMIGNVNGNKSISAYKDGILYKTWSSIKTAAKEVGGSPRQISKAAHGKLKTSSKLTWKFNT